MENFAPDEWIADTRAFVHMIGNSSMLQNLRCYFGTNVVIIGKNRTHAITHVGDTYINYGTTKTNLGDILLVPAIAKNLLFTG